MQDKTKREYTSVNHILKYIGVFGSVEALKILANVSRGKITAFFLGPVGVGLLAIYQNIQDVIQSCTNYGLEIASIQQLSEIDTDTKTDEAAVMAKVIRTWSMAVAFLSAMICVVVSLLFGVLFFADGESHHEIILLTPAAFLAPITAGECAILKGLHKLKRVATVELLGAVGSVLCSLIAYGTLGVSGILLAINLCIAIDAIVHLLFCTRIMPYRIDFLSKYVWVRGIPLLKFGIPYAVTAIMGAVTVTILYKLISSTSEVGFYKSAYALIVYYTGVIISSNATDYFPRLTSVCHDVKLKNDVVNRQIHVSLTVTAPLVMAFMLVVPVVIVMLYTPEFMPMAAICIMGGLFQLFRSVSQPLEYVSLAHGHSWLYLILEGVYNLILVVAVYFLHRVSGLSGIGMALSIVGVANVVILSFVVRLVYNIHITWDNWISIIGASVMTLVVMYVCTKDYSFLTVVTGVVLTMMVAIYSYLTLRGELKRGK